MSSSSVSGLRAGRLWSRLESWFSSKPSQASENVSHVIFIDFDRTLTVVHVFKSLAGWVDQEVGMLGGLGAVPAPHAVTERGQLMRIWELGTAWIEQAFGGRDRVCELRSMLALLAAKPGCRIIVLTRGYIGVARKCLQELGMLRYFHEVYGNTGAAYEKMSNYDRHVESENIPAEAEALLGTPEFSSWDSKAEIMFKCMQKWNLNREDVQFVDDDPNEIGVVSHAVNTVHVVSPAGITSAEVWKILSFAGLAKENRALQMYASWSALPDPLTCRPPPILTFNRAHLPVSLKRHLASLEEDLGSCLYPMKRIKLLLRNPMLMLAVAQREFVRHQLEGNKFTLKGMKKMIQSMQAQLGLQEDDVKVEDITLNRGFESAEPLNAYGSEENPYGLSTSVSVEFDPYGTQERKYSVEFEPVQSTAALFEDDDETQRPSPRKNLYMKPKTPSSKSVESALASNRQVSFSKPPEWNPNLPASVLYHTVAKLQQSLLGLTPIHMSVGNTNWRRQALIGVHDAKTSAVDAVWSRYEKLECLGAGHFGEVWRARELCSGKIVAVKSLERLDHDSGEDEEAGCLEIGVLKALAHPNLLRMMEAVKTKDELFIVSELAEGGSLSAYAKEKTNSSQDWIAGSLQQITSAVAHCHRNHVLHGDLKPENVLVGGSRPDKSPFCIVCDFGHTAICIGARIPIAAPGDPRYIAPEVMAEEFVSPKSDIYMLGVTGFELLSGGYLPYFNSKKVTLHASYYQLKLGGARERILNKEGLGPEELKLLKGVPKEATELMKSMLEKEEAVRPTAKDVLESQFIQKAHRPCKAAYDRIRTGWGLWLPDKAGFAEKLTRRTQTSPSYRLLLALVSFHGLNPAIMLQIRLLFRRMDEDGTGMITHAKFKTFCDRQIAQSLSLVRFEPGQCLSPEIIDALFKAGSLPADSQDQQSLDFRHVATLFFDLDTLSDEVLLQEIRSMLNRLRGPPQEFKDSKDAFYDPFMESYLVCRDEDVHEPRVNPDEVLALDPCVRKMLGEIRQHMGTATNEIDAKTILKVLREELI